MADLRRRNIKEDTSSSPPVDSVEKLSTVVQQAKQSASENGLTATDFMKCLGTAAEKSHLELVKKPKKSKSPAKKALSKGVLPNLFVCYKVMVVLQLVALLFYLLLLFSPAVGSLVVKVFHVHLYYMVRPVRIGIATIAPILNFVGLDLINNDCLMENPFLNEVHSCPCLHIKLPKELEINDQLPTIPDRLFDLPNQNVYIFRGALDTSNVTVEHFQDFKKNHPTHRGPKSCLKLTTNANEGVQKMSQLYNPELMKKYLVAEDPWAFTWEECPVEDRPQSFRSLLPLPSYLPPDIELSDVTLFILSTQWSSAAHSESSFPEASMVAMLVIVGEVRVSMDPANPDCYESCTPFRKQMILKAGDVLLFDQVHWTYMSVTWSKHAITSTVALAKPPTS